VAWLNVFYLTTSPLRRKRLLGNDLGCPMVTTDRRLRDEPGVDVVRT